MKQHAEQQNLTDIKLQIEQLLIRPISDEPPPLLNYYNELTNTNCRYLNENRQRVTTKNNNENGGRSLSRNKLKVKPTNAVDEVRGSSKNKKKAISPLKGKIVKGGLVSPRAKRSISPLAVRRDTSANRKQPIPSGKKPTKKQPTKALQS